MIFTSDNAVGAPQEILDAIAGCNAGAEMSYGADQYCSKAQKMIRELFEAPKARVFFLGTGTAANSIALATLCQPWDAIYCTEDAHINQDEGGAPEFFTSGAKLVAVEDDHGKMKPDALDKALKNTGKLGVHNVQKGPVSLTNLTEHGTAYRSEEIKALCDVAKSHNVKVHLDGARLVNAIVATGASFADMTWKAGVDTVVFGGTKNGLLFGEAVVIFDPELAWEFELRRKRGGHLLSKSRYLGAQFIAALENDNWSRWAENANNRMSEIYTALKSKVEFIHTPEGNIAHIRMSNEMHMKLMQGGARYFFDNEDNGTVTGRIVTHWQTSEEDVAKFIALF